MSAIRMARASWRWLTSMRTALLLLFLLAVAAVPGSLLPQRNVAIERVNSYLARNPELGPWLDRFSLFDVYASVWFSAIYLLLFVSLVGCLVPRLRQHLAALFAVPPDAPSRLDRLPHHAHGLERDGDPAANAEALRAALRGRRWRTAVRSHSDGSVTVAAEKGHLKETGNLVFHFALLAILVGVAVGSWFGWHGNRLVVAGPDYGFCNSLQQFDEYGLGARVSASDLPPFCVQLNDFSADYLDNGQPVRFSASVSYEDGNDPTRSTVVSVNEPLRLSRANVYLLGHGYAPVVRYTDRSGSTQTRVAPFLPEDGLLTSQGVVAFPDANAASGSSGAAPAQVAFAGVYLPTVPADPSVGRSAHPAERDPRLMLVAYQGDLGLETGRPRSVYELDPSQIASGRLVQVGEAHMMRVGESWTLPDGSTVEFLGTRPWVTVSVRHDPGSAVVLGGAVALLLGLMVSLAGKRRRVWARVEPTGAGRSLISLGGLTRSEHHGFAEEFARVAALVGADAMDRGAADVPRVGVGKVPDG